MSNCENTLQNIVDTKFKKKETRFIGVEMKRMETRCIEATP